ncbi:suppressor of cytokine signaling 1-like [Scyliorhinus canicula]|uniref:suppressor of cytokine signaling 1-like n=1 Tax=Scyliorhinus canicula TaxID=7830 RepID=UPI0018F70718|nr:suppressor of cytokine signaling 1-like [Scyliorhinus canicula]XP_038639734.1 suppressor of cytokine signaling 1-like [Scyliorhinus canicula]XP_038639735.1 suppressor of cytokine signaling 1-like [Scyliorhinus canicula]
MVGGSSQLDALADVRRPDPPRLQPDQPTHYRTFRNTERQIVDRTLHFLDESGFYWGPLPVDQAHAKLAAEPVGTFLVRDSTQANHLFSLSVRADKGPVSMRILFDKEHFWFNNACFDCIVKLLEYCVDSTQIKPFMFDCNISVVFRKPLRKQPIPKLQQLCRKSIIRHYGVERVRRFHLVSRLQTYIEEFPFKM